MGVSDDDEEAWLKAVVEAVERYCFAAPHDPSGLVRASYADVADRAVPVDRFQLFSPEQYEANSDLSSPSRDDEIDWAWAYSVSRGGPVLVPAALAHATVSRQPPNNLTPRLTSSGVATHVSAGAAVLAGILEVVERDAIVISWLNRFSPPRITLEGAPAELAELVNGRFALPDVEFVLLDLTPDSGIPTAVCLAQSDNPARPRSVMGAATRLDPQAAIRKALFEAAQLLYAEHDLGWSATSPSPSEVRTLLDHGRFYAGPAGDPHIRFLTESTRRVRYDEIPQLSTGTVAGDLQHCLDRLGAVGLEVLVVDLTPPDVARCGFRTVRVLIPGAVDLSGDARLPRLGSTRIGSMARSLGWPEPGVAGLNLAPCPMT